MKVTLIDPGEPVELRQVHRPAADGQPIPFCWYAEQRALGLGDADALQAALISHAGQRFQVTPSTFLFAALFPEAQCSGCLEWGHA